MRTLPTWAGRSLFVYDSSAAGGTTIHFGKGFAHTIHMTGNQYALLLQHFRGRSVPIGTSRDNPPPESVGEWLQAKVTKVAIASYVGPILIAEGYAQKVGRSEINFSA